MIGFIYHYSDPHNEPPRLKGYPAVCLMILIICWLFFRELQGKAIELTITGAGIIMRKSIRIGKPKTYLFTALDGFETGIINFRGAYYEKLYFVQQGKRVAEISGYYHENYDVLKNEIQSKLKFLGEIQPPVFLNLFTTPSASPTFPVSFLSISIPFFYKKLLLPGNPYMFFPAAATMLHPPVQAQCY